MQIKLIVTDMDDTLLRSDRTVSAYTRKVMQKTQQQGIAWVLASGRMVPSMLPTYHDLGLDTAIISFNGAVVMHPITGEVYHKQTVCKQDALALLHYMMAKGYYMQSYSEQDYFFEKREAWSDFYALIAGKAGIPVGDLISFVERSGDPVKLLSIDKPERIRLILPKVQAEFGDRMEICISKPQYIEFVNRAVNKGAGMLTLAQHMGIKSSEIVAFGDGLNDLKMLQAAGMGVAIGNAQPEVLQAVSYMTKTNDEDGVAYFIEKEILKG